MKELKIDDKVICIKSTINFTAGKVYKVGFAKQQFITIKGNYISETFYIGEENIDNVVVNVQDFFGTIKELRKEKIKKLKLFSENLS